MQRKGVTHEHLAGMIDCLLVAVSRISPEATLEEAATALLATMSDRLLDIGVGASIPRAQGSARGQGDTRGQGSARGQDNPLLIARSPRGLRGATRAPLRLFPEYALERSLPIEADEGSTVHIASDDENDLDELEVLMNRLALALGGVIRRARAQERSAAQAQELRTTRAQLIQSDKLASLGKIAAGIVHELNNPLTSIIAYSDYLHKKQRRGTGDPADIERLARIQESAARILGFTRDLIDYTRPSNEARDLVEIHSIIDRALVFCEHELEQLGVTIDKSFEDVPPVRGASGQLTQVFVNLFTNAAHAMRASGGHLRIELATSQDRQSVTITISDDGHGINDEHLELIFEPFFTTKTDGSGTGLGLSIVRDIIARHGGRIRAGHRAPQGTVFTIDLPAPSSSSIY
jgi:signal transduction histidine kinase